MEQIKLAFQQGELDYLDAIEALQKECEMSGKEAEALVEVWTIQMIDLAARIETHLDLDTTATLILTEDDFRSIVAALRNSVPPSIDEIANIISDYYDEDGEGRWRKCAGHIASTLTSQERP